VYKGRDRAYTQQTTGPRLDRHVPGGDRSSVVVPKPLGGNVSDCPPARRQGALLNRRRRFPHGRHISQTPWAPASLPQASGPLKALTEAAAR
jgi:hypothetical protein